MQKITVLCDVLCKWEKEDKVDGIPAFRELKCRKLCREVESLKGFTEVLVWGYEGSQGGYTTST